MSILRKRQDKRLDRRRSLSGIPVVNNNIAVEHESEGRVCLRITIFRGKGWLARFQPLSHTRSVRLDEIGSFVFDLIDGKRTVLDMINVFVDQYRMNRREAELSVVEFLKSLVRRNVVSILIK